MRFLGIVTFAALALSCTSSLATSIEYRKLTCPEIALEGRAISQRGFALSGLKAGPGGSESTATAPAIVFVWPPLGDKPKSDDLALAAKQMAAIEEASMQSQCSIRFEESRAR
jgi:hypothetical protein